MANQGRDTEDTVAAFLYFSTFFGGDGRLIKE